MKKALMIVLAVLISVAFVTTVFAQAPKPAAEKAAPAPEKKAAAPEKAPAPEKAKAEKPAKAAKAKAGKFAGEVASFEAGKTMVVKGKDGDKTFDVSAIKKEFKAGDKVTVAYTEKDGKMMASKVTAAKAAKAEKAPKAEKKAEKKAEEKPAAPAPAPAPAPAKK
jgi:hypothetical protein